jgi:hypothetical protein
MGLFSIFKRKKKLTHDEQLLADYQAGKFLQPDKDIDNKEYLRSLQNGEPTNPQ